MSVKRLRPSSSSDALSLSPSKRLVTCRLSSSKPALSPSNSTTTKHSAASPTSFRMSRTGSTKENLFASAIAASSSAINEDGDASMEDVGLKEETAMHDSLFDVVPSVPSTPVEPSAPLSTSIGDARAIPHIYAHASLLLSTSSSLSSSLPLEGRADQRETLLAFLTRRFPAVYAPLPSDSSSSALPPSTPSRPGPASMYVSGPPGIGKTALLASVIDELKQQVEERELGRQVRVHMENCATVSAGGAQDGAWDRLAKGLGIEVSEGMERMKGKERFEEGIKDGRKYLLILDEIDHLISPSSSSSSSSTPSRSSSAPDLLNALFTLASTPASPLTLIGIANDLTLKALSLSPATTPTKGKGKARLDPLHTPTKPIRLHFKPYSWQELVSIVAQRLALLEPSYPYHPLSSSFTAEVDGLPTPPVPASNAKVVVPLIATPALERLCKKIASTTGDVRTVLSLSRTLITLSLPSSLSPSDLAALTPVTAPKASMAHLTRALSAASYAVSGLAPLPSLKSRLETLQAGPHHRLVLVACLVALSRALPPSTAGLDATAAEAAVARVTVDVAFTIYRDVVIASSDALRATKLDASAFSETVGMVEDLCGFVVVRGRPGSAGLTSPSKRARLSPTKKSDRGRATVELSPSAPLPELLAALVEPPKEGREAEEDEPSRLGRRVLERERGEQRWRVRRREMGRDEEKRAEEELEGREWEREMAAKEAEK